MDGDGDDYLLPLRIGEELTLTGSLDIRVLRGAAEVWGSRLSHEFQRIVVPPWSATPRLLALRSSNEVEMEKETAEVRAFLEARKWPVVLCLRRATGAGHANRPSDPKERLESMREVLVPPDARPRLRAHRAWPSIVQHFVDHCLHSSSPESPAVLLVMGAKGVGKSTCCRFLVNSLLSLQVPEVFFLETDLGQPELGPPGVVTLHRIRCPMLQVPHSEQHRHESRRAEICLNLRPFTSLTFLNYNRDIDDIDSPFPVDVSGSQFPAVSTKKLMDLSGIRPGLPGSYL